MSLHKRKPPIRFGDLTRKIIIEQRIDTVDTTGELVPAWSTYLECYAAQIFSSGKEDFEAGRETEIIRYKYKIDGWDSAITAKMRINNDGEYHYITHREMLGLNKGTVIYTEVRDAS